MVLAVKSPLCPCLPPHKTCKNHCSGLKLPKKPNNNVLLETNLPPTKMAFDGCFAHFTDSMLY